MLPASKAMNYELGFFDIVFMEFLPVQDMYLKGRVGGKFSKLHFISWVLCKNIFVYLFARLS